MRRRSWAIPAAVLLVLAIVTLVWIRRAGRDDAALYRTEPVQRGDVRLQITATGTLNAMTTVQVGSQISGTIDALHADFNSQVRQGQLLAQIDPTFLKAQVAQSEADLERAEVARRQADRDYARQTPLREQGLASQAEIDAAETALEAARASVKSAEAALQRAKTNLRYATILSPIDGIVVSRNVDVGQTVAASLQAPTLFTIANDLTRMQLEASVDEADIGLVELGQTVTFTVDAYPERVFRGTVEQIRLSPKTDQNVVSYTVIVHVANPEQKLLPGMTANATFQVAEALGTLMVPAAALRFRPGSSERTRPGTLHVMDNGGRLRRISARPGISDGTYTAVASDSLSEGMQVVVGLNRAGGSMAAQGTVNPFAPGGTRRDRR
ncbi:MAG: efflux RND transporter periplasmic adaptor subunit [Candidatus Eisenbacteria bacterium]|nr:efflux RND transporter periplasmic adaptor subunit [Candidatus Eisenbacteria bacterium]